MLAVMFSGRHPFSKDREGRYFIDRDGQYFGHILSYLRSDALPPEDVAQFVLREAEFFCLQVRDELVIDRSIGCSFNLLSLGLRS